jgi:hypothetical protein
VLVEGQLPVGEIVPVRISGALAYDLVGTVETGAPHIVSLDSIPIDGSQA